MKMGMHTGHLGEVLLQQVISLDHKVALLVSLYGDVGHLEIAVVGRGKCFVHHLHLECIL